MDVFFSNRIELLFREFKGRLFKQGSPFTQRYIIVPSPAMKNWLMTAMAHDPDLGIAAGVHIFTSIDAAIREIAAKLSQTVSGFPKFRTQYEMAIRLEAYMRRLEENQPALNEDECAVWSPLLRYFQSQKTKDGTIPRLTALAGKLANLFMTYGKFGTKMLRKWKEDDREERHWQQLLWKNCIGEYFPEKCEWKYQESALHVFGLSFIPSQAHELFLSLSQTIPVFYYLLSPCKLLWSEILSDRESRKLLKYWQKKGAAEAQQLALEEFLYDRNALLANFGKVGREMALQIENSPCTAHECYEIPENLAAMEQYRELIDADILLSPDSREQTLLHALQADLLLMRTASPDCKIDFTEDKTIQLHSAPSLMREVQSLYDVLAAAILRHKEDEHPIYPKDIIVLAPDIIKYEPYIRAVFGHEESKLNFQLMDLNLLCRHSLVQGFFHLLALASSRWDAYSVLKLFENPAFLDNQNMSFEDAQKIKSYIRYGDIRWGMDSSHRKDILQKEFEGAGEIGSNPSGTWTFGINRLLLGMAMIPAEEGIDEEAALSPLNLIDSSQGQLFGRWIQLIKSLKEDLKPLIEEVPYSLKTWSIYLKCLLDTYFLDEKQQAKYAEEAEALRVIIEKLALESRYENEAFPFSTVKYHLEHAIKEQRVSYRESHLNAVRFCSLLPMRTVPSKVIALLGMGEEDYPRRDFGDSLNMLKGNAEADYCPTRTDFDRYLFLETLLSARQYYILSYCCYSKTEGKEMQPSLLINELFQYLDGAFTIDHAAPSAKCSFRHPYSPCDKQLFGLKAEMQSFSNMYYKAAKALYEKEKQPLHSFVPAFKRKQPAIPEISAAVDLKMLDKFAKNPIDAYLRRQLNIHLNHFEQTQIQNEEDFTLDLIKKGMWRKNSLKRPLEAILKDAGQEGKLPIGPFREVSLDKLFSEAEEINSNFEALAIDKSSIFSLHLSESHASVQQNEKGDWLLPPLKCAYQGMNILITGTLPEVCRSGMITICRNKREEAARFWPGYLVFLSLVKQHSLPFGRLLVFAREGKTKEPFFEDPFPLLKKYLCYYINASETISPLIPEWTPEIAENDSSKFAQTIASTLKEENEFFFNDTLKWLVRGSNEPDHQIILDHWSEIANDVFGELYRNWYPRKAAKKGRAGAQL